MANFFKKDAKKQELRDAFSIGSDKVQVDAADLRIFSILAQGDNNCNHMNFSGIDFLLFQDKNDKNLAVFHMTKSVWEIDFGALNPSEKDRKSIENLAAYIIERES